MRGDNDGRIIPFAKRIFGLLNRPQYGKFQNTDGVYGAAREIALRDFKSHLDGRDSIAVSTVNVGKAKFLAVDVDRDFNKRLPIFASVLARRELDYASFAVTGSDAERGKVIVTLQTPLPQRQAIRLVQDILSDAVADAAFGQYKAKDASVYPTGGDGSHVRILGRNLRRARHSGLHEIPMNLLGELSDLCYVQPAAIEPEQLGVPNGGLRTRISTWAELFIGQPYVGTTLELHRSQVRLAHEAVELFGEAASAQLQEWFAQIEAGSPSISASCRRQLTRPDVVQRIVTYVRSVRPDIRTLSIPGYRWCPKSEIQAPRPAIRAYTALTEYVLDRQLDPHCFAMAYSTVAALTGYCDKGRARQAILRAEDAGLIVRLDNGVADQRYQLCALYALVGEGDDPTTARAKGASHPKYADRIAERTRLGHFVQTAVQIAA